MSGSGLTSHSHSHGDVASDVMTGSLTLNNARVRVQGSTTGKWTRHETRRHKASESPSPSTATCEADAERE